MNGIGGADSYKVYVLARKSKEKPYTERGSLERVASSPPTPEQFRGRGGRRGGGVEREPSQRSLFTSESV